MTKVESLPALQEIKHDIIKQDFTKARLVIDYFPELDRPEQDAILLELCETADPFAIPILSYGKRFQFSRVLHRITVNNCNVHDAFMGIVLFLLQQPIIQRLQKASPVFFVHQNLSFVQEN